ncbi:MAG TPA: MarR family transcriptional regulator [Candidatus Ruania gallistercoris]|uniref:MarR family transcriptional regulator n=1 Tax=Candidatus Ruania gallistercoris TaxID=2838746 RepID=A0A9D2EBE6_9MICO|nr:MarR family transcriptional regulator [Candidatus Ruania gallistercoris]
MDQRDELIERVLTAHEQSARVLLSEDLSDLFDATLTMQQIKLMVVLRRDGPTSGHELADRLAVSTPTVSGIVDRLAERGMLERRTDDRDRRVRLVALTTTGEQLVASVHEAGWRIGREVMDRMELADLRALAQGLAALAHAAQCRAQDSPGR